MEAEHDGAQQGPGHGLDGNNRAAQADSGKRARQTGRKNRAWFKYCKSLPTHLQKPPGVECAAGVATSAEGCRSEPATHDQERLRGSDPARDEQGRKAGLPEAERCTVWLPQKKRLCSQRRSSPGSLFCIAHLLNPPPMLPQAAASGAPDHSQSVSSAPGSATNRHVEMITCEHCGAAVAAAKLDKHLGRCNVLRKQALLEAAPYFRRDANSGAAPSPEHDAPAGAAGCGQLASLGESEFAARVRAWFQEHVPASVGETMVLEAAGCSALFEASLAVRWPYHLPHPPIHPSIHISSRVCVLGLACVSARAHTRTRARTHTHTHAGTRARAHTHTHTGRGGTAGQERQLAQTSHARFLHRRPCSALRYCQDMYNILYTHAHPPTHTHTQ